MSRPHPSVAPAVVVAATAPAPDRTFVEPTDRFTEPLGVEQEIVNMRTAIVASLDLLLVEQRLTNLYLEVLANDKFTPYDLED